MATMTLTIPDAQLTRVVNALCAQAGLTGGAVTTANARLQIVALVKDTVVRYEADQSKTTNDIDVT